MSNHNPVRWGILGYARIAREKLIPAIQEAPSATLYAIASRDMKTARDAAQAHGFAKAYDDYQKLLDDPDVDAVYIPLPNGLHKEWTVKAAAAGKHVLCEKPMALTAADCQEMADACEKHGVTLMEAFMYRFTTRTRKIQELLQRDVLGPVRHVHSNFSFFLTGEGDVRLDKALGGGALWDVGCYPINMIGMVMGEAPVSFSAQRHDVGGVDMGLSAVLKYRNGAICTASGAFDACSARVTEITGTKASLVIRDSFFDSDAPLLLVTDDAVTEIPVEACKRYVLQVEAFDEAILRGGKPPLDIQETIRNCGLIAEILEAVR